LPASYAIVTASKSATPSPSPPTTVPAAPLEPLAADVPFVPASARVEPEGQAPLVDVDDMEAVE